MPWLDSNSNTRSSLSLRQNSTKRSPGLLYTQHNLLQGSGLIALCAMEKDILFIFVLRINLCPQMKCPCENQQFVLQLSWFRTSNNGLLQSFKVQTLFRQAPYYTPPDHATSSVPGEMQPVNVSASNNTPSVPHSLMMTSQVVLEGPSGKKNWLPGPY